MKEYKNDISKARIQLEEAKTNLFKAYLSKIRDHYQTLNPKQREFVLDGLDALVGNIENGSFTRPISKFSAKKSARKNLMYDPEKAKEVRKKAGLKISELAEELGLGRSGYVQLGGYESRDVKPSNPPRGKASKAYIDWLKEHGYNPFDL